MKINSFDLDHDVLVIAEIGNNHEGDFTLAEEMLGRAAEAGAHAVKFQTFVPEHYQQAADSERLKRLGTFRLSDQSWAKLAAQAERAGVMFMSTPFDIASARLLAPLVPAFKISSGDNTFLALLESVADTAKPIILSCGLADLREIRQARATIENRWAALGVDPGLALLHCVTAYPVPPEQANLAAIGTLRAAFPELTIGYSDHTLGNDAAIAAVALGARIVEKHFTLDKNLSDFRDHQLSATPDELAALVVRIAELRVMLGDGAKSMRSAEAALEPAVRRSIAAGRDLPVGHVLRWDDLTWVRPGSGLPPGAEKQVLGMRLTRALRLGEILTLDSLSEVQP